MLAFTYMSEWQETFFFFQPFTVPAGAWTVAGMSDPQTYTIAAAFSFPFLV